MLLMSGKPRLWFGDGRDGDFVSTGNVTFSVTTNGPPVVKQYRSFHLKSGHVMTVSNRCRGLIIYVQGDCRIDGTISMDQKGAWLPLESYDPLVFPVDVRLLLHPGKEIDASFNNVAYAALMGGAGGNGGNGGWAVGYNKSLVQGGRGGRGGRPSWFGGGVGGGGGGGAGVVDAGGGPSEAHGGDGGDAPNPGISGAKGPPGGTVYQNTGPKSIPGQAGTNGAGGAGGAAEYNRNDSPTGYAKAGSGGSTTAGWGAGGGGGASAASYGIAEGGDGQNGASWGGGLVVLVVGGNLTITGKITARGGPGANGGAGATSGYAAGGGGGGGGCGGGVVLLFHRGTYQLTGSIDVSGGAGGTGGAKAISSTNYYQAADGAKGYDGHIGTIKVVKV